MNDLVILVPTRSRPHAVRPLIRAFTDTCTADTRLTFCIDGCPRREEYFDALIQNRLISRHVAMCSGPRRRLVGTLNHYAGHLAESGDPPYAIGYMGDDHRPVTPGWDSAYLDALRKMGTGIVYGDDGVQGQNLPTQVAITSDIIAKLGYMVPPCLGHMYCDNFWKDLGERAGCLTYLPDVKITHLHPSTGQAEWDDSYRETNAPTSYATDAAAYQQYATTGYLDADVDTVRKLRGDDR